MNKQFTLSFTRDEVNLIAFALGMAEDYYTYESGNTLPHASANANTAYLLRETLFKHLYPKEG
jgi:hypothetical protein